MLVLLLTIQAVPLGAQEAGSFFCLRGAPPPDCRGFFRVEIRGGGAIGESPRTQYQGERGPDGAFVATDSLPWYDLGDWIGAEVGYALNVGERWALGATVAVETGNETTRYLLRGRARRWLTPRLYADFLPGVFRQKRDLLYRSGDALVRNTGLSAEARAGLSGFLFASVRYDVLQADPVTLDPGPPRSITYDPGGRAHAFSIGGGLEGRTALVTGTIALLVAVALTLIGVGPAT
jgi:hypothetical protein